MVGEFRSFLLKTNALALAIGVIIGTALGTVVNSLVNDIIMPPIGLVLGGLDFSQLFVVLSGDGDYNTIEQAKEAGAVTWNIGLFVNAVIKFLIVAFALFLLVKGFNTLRRKQDVAPVPETPVTPPRSELLLEEIRDLLARRTVA